MEDSPTSVLAATGLTRRAAIAASFGVAATGLLTRGATAQDDAASDDSKHPAFLFVQVANEGTWAPKPGEDDVFTLTLSGVSDQTIYFSDRPDRIVGAVPLGLFLDNLGFTPINPPNAAAVVTTPEGERDVLVIELFNPTLTQSFGDSSEAALVYDARILDAYAGDGLRSWHESQEDFELPAQFSQVSLFIDDCPAITSCLRREGWGADRIGDLPDGAQRQCYDVERHVCQPCIFPIEQLMAACNAAYPACDGSCLVG